MKTIKSLPIKGVSYVKACLSSFHITKKYVVKSVVKYTRKYLEKLKSILKSVYSANRSLQEVVIKQSTAQESVENLDVELVGVVSKEYLGVYDVYNLSTDTHNYIANGCIVHNCDGMTQIMSIRIAPPSGEVEIVPKVKSKFDMIFNDENFVPKESIESSYVV